MKTYRELVRLYEECKSELDSIGVEYGNVEDLKINTRAESFWGRCRKRPNGTYQIEVTKRLLECENDKDIKDTLIHELLHTCKNCMKHTGEWKVEAAKVNRLLGYNIKRTSSSSEKGLEPRQKMEIRYILKCNNQSCGHEYKHSRRTKSVNNPSAYRCVICRGDLSLIIL